MGPVDVSDSVLDTLAGVLREAAGKDPAATAIVVTQGGPTLTYAGLEAAVNDAAGKLRALGVAPGDLVSLAYPNSIEFVVLFLAITRARAVAAPLNAAYTQDEFKFYMEDAQSKLLLLPPAKAGGVRPAEGAAHVLGIRVAVSAPLNAQGLVDLSLLPPPPAPGTTSEPATPIAASDPGPLPSPSDVALFLHTSGTTSRPKGVPLTHRNLTTSIANIVATYAFTPLDRTYLVMPLFHVHGLMAALLSSLASGGSVVLPSAGRFSASVFWDEVKEHGATWYTAVPTMHQILLSRHKALLEGKTREGGGASGDIRYPSLRFIRSCSASLAKAVLEEMEAVFGAPVLEAYAMTEASHQMTANPLPSHGPHKPSSVGKATGIELAILDESGKVLGTGERGEVCIRGPNVTEGYRNNPTANEQAFAFGWFHTGDQGYLDEDGYLFLTGRLKELINRGGEKISPLEVDAAMLGVPGVAEAVAFSAPDGHYGEEVNAAVVLREGASLTAEELTTQLKKHLAAFKVPKRVFFVTELPRTATGKIQRRFVAEKMLSSTPSSSATQAAAPSASEGKATATAGKGGDDTTVDTSTLLGRALAALGVKAMFGVVGIPVTAVATGAQAAGVRYIGFRNEQAAGFAAAAYGYLTGVPGVLLTVSGPGCVNGLAGLGHGWVNGWPLLMVSGSCTRADIGKGDFQELDQLTVVKPFVKYAGQAGSIQEVTKIAKDAMLAALAGRPGATYIDLPADMLHQSLTSAGADAAIAALSQVAPPWVHPLPPSLAPPPPDAAKVAEAAALLRSSQRPLLIIGEAAAYARAEKDLEKLVEITKLPFVPTPMGKGTLPDAHPQCAGAARSLALARADVALVVGARLNWMLHFGEPPRWPPGVKFVLVDPEAEEVEKRKPAVGLVGEVGIVVRALVAELTSGDSGGGRELLLGDPSWREELKAKVTANSAKLAASLTANPKPLNFHSPLRILRDAIAAVGSPAPILVSEGANTMDIGRTVIDQSEPRTRLDAAAWGTMGVGLGYAVGAAVAEPERLVVALEGDSAFGFSGMEVETIARFKLPVVIIVMNNSGVYGGDRRGPIDLPPETRHDPAPTAFVPGARYDLMMEALGGKGYNVETAEEMEAAVKSAFAAREPALINVVVDPFAGVESGRMTHKN